MRTMLEEAWEHLCDPYWRADHPEVTAVFLSLITGVIGLAFAWLQRKILTGGNP